MLDNHHNAEDIMLKEEEIRPTELMQEAQLTYARDVERLMRHRENFVAVVCPACENSQSSEAFCKYGMSYLRCQQCDTLYASPRPTPAQMLEHFAESENYDFWNKHIFPRSEDARRQKIFIPRVDMVLDVCRRYAVGHHALLEVGAGFGTFCEEMNSRKAFARVMAVEPSSYLAETCRKKGITTIEKTIEDIEAAEIGGQVDVIVSFEVIEHLFSPREYVLKCASLLNEGGFLMFTCPNSHGFDVVVMGEQSSAVHTEHINLFNLDSLSYLLTSCGLEVVERQTPGKLDAELVRKAVLAGEFDLQNQPFLRQILLEGWQQYGEKFQEFLSATCLSSHMLVVARKPSSKK